MKKRFLILISSVTVFKDVLLSSVFFMSFTILSAFYSQAFAVLPSFDESLLSNKESINQKSNLFKSMVMPVLN